MEFLAKEILEYSLNFTQKESKLLEELNRETYAKMMMPRMLSGHMQGRFLSMISKMIMPETIIEIGTYTGYSALCLAEGLKKSGKIHTIDINEEYTSFAKRYFQKSKYSNNIIQHIGDAKNIIPNIQNKAQLIFIDADKESYNTYYNLSFKKLDVGGYIIADNVLWSGKVIKEEKDHETSCLHQYNKIIHEDNKVENILLPIRDGIMISKKISD